MCLHIDHALTHSFFQEPEYDPDHTPKWGYNSDPDEASIVRGFKVICSDWTPPFCPNPNGTNLYYRYKPGWNTAYATTEARMGFAHTVFYPRPMTIDSIESLRDEILNDTDSSVYEGLHFFLNEEAARWELSSGRQIVQCFALKRDILAFGRDGDCVATRLYLYYLPIMEAPCP